MRVLSYGEILWDIIEGQPYLGGAPFNGAAHLAKCGADTYMISRLGKDELGKRAFSDAQKIGVHTTYIQWDEEHPTGTVDVFLNEGQPSYTIHPKVAYDFIDFATLEDAGLLSERFDVFSFGSLVQRDDVSRTTLHRLLEHVQARHFFYDVNLRKDCFTKEIIHASLSRCTILKLNDEEVIVLSELLFGQEMDEVTFCRQIVDRYGEKVFVITLGAKGCLIYQEGKMESVAGQKVEVVDTVGAGDSFSAAFLFKYLQHGDAVTAANVANQVGGFVASSRGPIPPYSDGIRRTLGI